MKLGRLSGARSDPVKMTSAIVFPAGNEGESSDSVTIVFSGHILLIGVQG